MSSVVGSSLTLAGPGKAGRAFLRSWREAGGRLAQVITRASRPASALRDSNAAARTWNDERFAPTDLLILAVPDDEIARRAAMLAERLPCRFAFHFSGALGADVLSPLREAGASVASLHPLRAFTGAGDESWRGAFIAVEGDAAAAERGESVARALAAHPHRISAAGKPLYHAAASLAAGGAVAVLSVAVRAGVAAGLPEEVARKALAELASQATAAAARVPFAEALTGAVARRDVGTVGVHARALAREPDALALYRALAEEILAATPGRGREQEIREILSAETRRERGVPGVGANPRGSSDCA